MPDGTEKSIECSAYDHSRSLRLRETQKPGRKGPVFFLHFCRILHFPSDFCKKSTFFFTFLKKTLQKYDRRPSENYDTVFNGLGN